MISGRISEQEGVQVMKDGFPMGWKGLISLNPGEGGY